ncbi:transcriptional regulator, TetR family [Actinacidiphila yanglinensis]|uniref:Transcriptional regulator, TetR family n=1 Tax=Actinacidiphila yanglinensis TaxID=310779 RepID=A0A1H6DVE8_9ACTN|nr:TetR/AcrR family transcriptional regulator [Actinacidiphila yanglinensis]SEG89189.1 transcriptional regulator, TetR family [Actinacidiphila yanglinensis]
MAAHDRAHDSSQGHGPGGSVGSVGDPGYDPSHDCGGHPADDPAGAATPGSGGRGGPAARPMRRDAARNHRLVIAAAREVLTEYGTDASMELIASRAGVGIGTLYRRFPNKEALLNEIAAQMLGELVGEARTALSYPGGTGFEAFVRVFGRWLSEHRGYAEKLIGHTKATCVQQLRDLFGQLLHQAQESGRIGPDVELGDVMALVWGLRGVVETSGTVVPDAWQRYAEIHLAGMRVPGAPGAHPAVTREELGRITANG